MQGNWVKYFVREYAPVFRREVRRFNASAHYNPTKPLTFRNIAYTLERDYNVMARKKSQSSEGVSGSIKASSRTIVWLNYRLSQEDTAIVLSDCDDLSSLCARLAGIFVSGADFSVRYNSDRKNYSAFVTNIPGTDDSTGYAISAFGGTVWQAISAILFKCDVYTNEPGKLIASGQGMGIG